MAYYLQHLGVDPALGASATISRTGTISLTLAGYSYGSLILARLPSIPDIIKRFEAAEVGTAAAEIILRARTLAKQTRQGLEEQFSPVSPRGRTLKPEQSPTSPSKRASPMTVGGEETDPSERRRSRDSRRSVDVIRKSIEAPHRIKAHIKHRHVSREQTHLDETCATTPKTATPASGTTSAPTASSNYLLISPVLMPFSNALLPPGAPTSGFSLNKGDIPSPKQYLEHPSLTVFGSNDAFTSRKRLRQWAEKQTATSRADFRWTEIDGAGHFWGEAGVLRSLQRRVVEWIVSLEGGKHGGSEG